MTCYRIVVAYDGTGYHGWQAQSTGATIQQVLTDSFESVFLQKASILGASRTDAGVHALWQVAILRSPINISADKIKHAWNNDLPGAILVRSVEKLDQLIHPHDGVVQKTYMYHFFMERPTPFLERYGWYFKRKVDLDFLDKALKIFVGTHDFRSFFTGNDTENSVRKIDGISLEFMEEYQAYRITIKGKGFLRYMVRRIVGACLEVASQDNLTLDLLKEVLEKKNPHHILPNSPAKGLLLYKIDYENKG